MSKARLQSNGLQDQSIITTFPSLPFFSGIYKALKEQSGRNTSPNDSNISKPPSMDRKKISEDGHIPTGACTPDGEIDSRANVKSRLLAVPESKYENTASLPTIGIVGGMGIEATQEFQMLITQAAKVLGYVGEENFVPTIVDNTRKPDRSAFLLGRSDESPVNAISAGCQRVAGSGANLILIPCNTAHAFIDEVQERSPIPIISLVDLTNWYVKTKYPSVKKVGFLGTDGSVCETSREKPNFYHQVFKKNNIDIITPDSDIQQSIMNAIYDEYGVKNGITRKTPLSVVPEGSHPNTRFYNGVEHLCDKIFSKPKIIIAGCTEVPLGLLERDVEEKAILIDPMKIAALATVIICHDRNFSDYMERTKDGEINQTEVLRLAREAYTVNRPITTQDLKELADRVAELNQAGSINASDGYSSDGISECNSMQGEASPAQIKEEIKAIAKKHNCFMVKGKSTLRHGNGNEDVLRVYFSKSPPLARKDIQLDMLEFEKSIKALSSCIGSEEGKSHPGQVRVHQDYMTIPFSEEVKSQLIEMELDMKLRGMSR